MSGITKKTVYEFEGQTFEDYDEAFITYLEAETFAGRDKCKRLLKLIKFCGENKIYEFDLQTLVGSLQEYAEAYFENLGNENGQVS